MIAPDDHRRAAAARVLALRARGDLQSVEAVFGGETTFVVHDPATGESFHLSAVEHRLLEALRQRASLRDLQRIVEQEFAPRRATISQLQQFVAQLHGDGLLVSDSPGQGAELAARGRSRRRRSRWASLMQVLAIRVGGFSAAPVVDRLYGAMRWVFSPWAMAAVVLTVVYAAVLTVGNAHTIAARLPALGELVQPRRWPAWIAAIAGVKILHELGHALVCRHFGARPREMGLLLLAGAPALYCDVSDAWRLPSKWQRMAVSGAGMAVELVIASICAILWWRLAPGALRAICLSLIVVCSMGTLAINANPLLRYDGYHLLADWLETPNLAQRARGLVGTAWRRWLLGQPSQEEALLSAGKRRALWVYAILSKLYLTLVLAGIFLLMVKLARPRGLENLVYTMAAVTLAGLVMSPTSAIVKMAANPNVRARLKWVRVAATLAILGGVGVAAWFWPVTRRVQAPLVAVPAGAQPLFAVTAGELQFAVVNGARVESGEVVARLANPELELKLIELQGIVRERRVHLDQLRTLQLTLAAASRMIPTAASELADSEAQLAAQQAMVEALLIRAGGWPRARGSAAAGAAGRRRDIALVARLAAGGAQPGAWIEAGTPLAVVAPTEEWIAWAGVDQADVPAVDVDQPARILMDDRQTSVLMGRVTLVGRRARDNRFDDGTSQRDDAIVGDDRYHVVELAVEAADARLLAGERGTVKIATYESTLGELAWLKLRQMFAGAF